jgi:hypothetical protein
VDDVARNHLHRDRHAAQSLEHRHRFGLIFCQVSGRQERSVTDRKLAIIFAASARGIIASGRKYVKDPDITGILVTPMAAKGGVEVIIGVVRDPTAR